MATQTNGNDVHSAGAPQPRGGGDRHGRLVWNRPRGRARAGELGLGDRRGLPRASAHGRSDGRGDPGRARARSSPCAPTSPTTSTSSACSPSRPRRSRASTSSSTPRQDSASLLYQHAARHVRPRGAIVSIPAADRVTPGVARQLRERGISVGRAPPEEVLPFLDRWRQQAIG